MSDIVNVGDKELDKSPDEAFILKAVSLSRSFSIGEAEVSVLKGLSLDIKRYEKLFLRGASGAGKSTLLYTLAGLEKPDSGSVIIDGKSLYDLSSTEQTIFRNKKIGYVFQNYFLMPDLNALENVTIPSMIKGRNDDVDKAVELLEKVGLRERLNHRPSELSGGEQQRVAIARALINDPEIIFADEPTGNLDSLTEEELMETLMNLVTENKKTLIVVTHDSKLAKLGDRQLVLADGQIMA
ncbi:MAG: ABC transporter ATP-binding protein [Verrucomicrobiales bacterium]